MDFFSDIPQSTQKPNQHLDSSPDGPGFSLKFTSPTLPHILKDQFEPKLNRPRTSRKHTRVVKRGARHIGKRQIGCIGNPELARINDAAVANRQLLVIEGIKHFGPELQSHAFPNFKILENRDVKVVDSR